MITNNELEHNYRYITEEENKKLILDMMQFVHEYCEQKDIRYFLYFGSLLGAVRHKGFIPWDDDIDICMTRSEYERFIKIFPRGDEARYTLINYEDDKNYVPYAKIIDNDTYLIEREDKPLSVYIDLFIIDNEGQTLNSAKTFLHFVSFFFIGRVFILPEHTTWDWRKKCIHKCFHWISNWFTENNWLQLIDRVSKLKSSKELSTYVGSVNASEYNERQILRGEWFKEGILADFENRKFWIPKDYDNILKTIYVNYMDLPSEADRIAHHENSKRWIKKL